MKDLGDEPEVEMKFFSCRLLVKDADWLDRVASALPPGLVVWCASPVVLIDIYFDAPGLPLGRHGAALRLRRANRPYHEKKRYNANFKFADLSGTDTLNRREIRTRITTQEALKYSDLMHWGKAGQGALDCLAGLRPGHGGDVVPVVRLLSHRRMYLVTSEDSPTPEDNLLAFIAEDVRATALNDCEALDLLLRAGYSPYKSGGEDAQFRCFELERTGTGQFRTQEDWAFELFQAVVKVLRAITGVDRETKYQTALRSLGMIE